MCMGGGGQTQYYTPPDPGGASAAEVARLARLHAQLGDDPVKNAAVIEQDQQNATLIDDSKKHGKGGV